MAGRLSISVTFEYLEVFPSLNLLTQQWGQNIHNQKVEDRIGSDCCFYSGSKLSSQSLITYDFTRPSGINGYSFTYCSAAAALLLGNFR